MILKFFEIKKKNLTSYKYFLLYGKNKGLIEETIQKNLKPVLSKNIYNYEESEVLNNKETFKENILNKSFFEDENTFNELWKKIKGFDIPPCILVDFFFMHRKQQNIIENISKLIETLNKNNAESKGDLYI